MQKLHNAVDHPHGAVKFYEDRAEEMRTLRDCMKYEHTRALLDSIALAYDNMAVQARLMADTSKDLDRRAEDELHLIGIDNPESVMGVSHGV